MHSRAILLVLATVLQPCFGQGIITTLVGTDWFFQGNGHPVSTAPLGRIERMVFDRNGNLYIADPDNSMVFKVDTAGVLTVVAGNGRQNFSGDNGPATAASLDHPTGVRVDPGGNVYIAENGRIRKVSSDGVISTLAGTGVYGFNGDGIPATSAALRGVPDIALDSGGNIYLCDANRVRKITVATGLISTIAGAESPGFSGDGGPATAALLNEPSGVFIDTKGQIFIADTDNYRVRRIDTNGVIQTVAGNGDFVPFTEGVPATTVAVQQPTALTMDSAGALYIADAAASRIVKVTADGLLNTVAGNLANGFSGDGGPANKATLYNPMGVAVDAQGAVYISDTVNRRIRRVSTSNIISAFAGSGAYKFGGDGGPASAGLLDLPTDLIFDLKGNIYISDTQNNRVRKIDKFGIISTFAGDGFPGFSGDGGQATLASLDSPTGLAVDPSGNVYVSDSNNGRVRRIDGNGIITTFAGGGNDSLSIDAAQLEMHYPSYLAFDRAGNLYISETGGFRVRKVTQSGAVATYAGTGEFGSSVDGTPALKAQLGYIGGINFDSKGNFYIAELYSGRVRKVSTDGILSTYAGNGLSCCSGDGGPALQASLDATAIVVDTNDDLYIAGGSRVRKVAQTGTISTVAGGGAVPDNSIGDGGTALGALLRGVSGIRTDASENLYVADSEHDRIRQILNVPPPFTATPELITFHGQSGGLPAIEQSILVTSSVTNLAYSVTASTSNGNWLRVKPEIGLAPGTIEVTADPQTLPPGDYEGTISIQSPQAIPSLRIVNVKFSVAPADAPTLVAEPTDLAFDFVTGLPSDSNTLMVRNNGSGEIPFVVTAATTNGGQWLSVTPSSGTATAATPVTVTVTADPAQLLPGTYSGLISITSDALNQRLFVPITTTVHSTTQTIVLSDQGLSFAAVAGSVIQRDTFEVLNSGLGNLDWTATAEVLSGGVNWLSATPARGSSGPGKITAPQVEVSADPSQLRPGDYYGRVLISAPGAGNSPQTISVVFHVRPAGSGAVPDLRPTGFIFVASASGQIAPQDVIVSNTGGVSTAFRSTRSSDSGPIFFTHQPTEATVDPTQPVRISIQPVLTGLGPGVRRGRINLEFTDGSVKVVEIVLVIPQTSASTSASKKNPIPRAAGCTPTSLNLVFSLLGQQFKVPAAWPSTIEARVADDCGNSLDTGSVVASFSNGDPPLSLRAVGDGRWTNTWQPSYSASQVRVTAAAENAGHTLKGSTQISGEVTPNPTVPVIVNGSIVSAASLSARAPLAPGGIISIFGSNLSTGVAESGVPRDTSLNGTLVVIGGIALPLLYVSDTQVNAIVPSSIPVNTTQQVLVQSKNSLTLPIPISIAPAQPAVFTANGRGIGQGHIYGPSGKIADSANPVRAGDAIVIYCTGLGAVDRAVSDGFPAPSDPPLAGTTNSVTATIGGKPASVFFSGLAPTYTGLYQVNAIVPDGVGSDDAAPLILTVAGQVSPTVTLSVR